MRTTVTRPVDSLFVMERIFATYPYHVDAYNVQGVGQVLTTPSSYLLHATDSIGIELSQAHPAWLYSGMDYNDDVIVGRVTYRRQQSDIGYDVPVHAVNVKKQSQTDTLKGLVNMSTFTYYHADNIPINYYGRPFDKTTPDADDDQTIITEIIDDDVFEVKQDSPCEFTITVKQDLTEDAWFYLPVANPKGSGATIWGEVGADSTLPEGCAAGLINLRTEALLDASRGTYVVSGDKWKYTTMFSGLVYRNTTTTISGQVWPNDPDWYMFLESDTLKAQQHWKTLDAMVKAEEPYFAYGWRSRTGIVGTGLFVVGNQTRSFPFGKAGLGVSGGHEFTQSAGSPTEFVTIKGMARANEFLKELVSTLVTDTYALPTGVVVPFAASELQFSSKADGPYKPLQDPKFSYTYPAYENDTPVSVLPIYLPVDSGHHRYTPFLNCMGSTKVMMLNPRFDLGEQIRLYTKLHQSVLNCTVTPSETGIPDIIIASKTMSDGNLEDPIAGFSRGRMGFHSQKDKSAQYYYNSNGSFIQARYTWNGYIYWSNPSIDPTVGRDYQKTGDTSVCNAILSAMTSAFVGFFAKGTAAGTYQYKPFQSTESMSGCINAADPKYVSARQVAIMKPETPDTPLLGKNLVTAEYNDINWFSEEINDNTYKAWQTMQFVSRNYTSRTRIADEFVVALQLETVPFIGYPTTNRPLLIDLDEWDGWVCDVEDLVMTAPFYDEDINQWVVVAASGQVGKMYRIDVDMDSTNQYVTAFLRVRDSRDIFETPYGHFEQIYGICHTRDIHYGTGKEDDHLVVYGRMQKDISDVDKGSNFVIATCRTYLEWDSNNDTVSRLRLDGVSQTTDVTVDNDIAWPYGIAVMYPYIYILGYRWETVPTNPVVDPLLTSKLTMTGAGWQMSLWKFDITSGLVQDFIPLRSAESLRFTFGVPASDKDSRTLMRGDRDTIGKAMSQFSFASTANSQQLPVSANLPKVNTSEFPSLAGLTSMGGMLIAFSNYMEHLVLINPITGCVETLGYNIFPYAYPFNKGVAAGDRVLATVAKFGGKFFYTVHPFFGVCMGDGLPPNRFGTGIDIQDVTKGLSFMRLVKLRNNHLRDEISKCDIIVPDEDELPGSSMLSLSLDGVAAHASKRITINDPVYPSGTHDFYVHLNPESDDPSLYKDKFILYVNAEYSRKTVYFGYLLRL